MKQLLELRKTRDFGQVINDSFTFLKENFKPLFTALLIICGALVLIGTVTSVFQYMSIMGIYSSNFSSNANLYEGPAYTSAYWLSFFFNLIVLMMLVACIHLVTLCYMSIYLQKNKEQPTFIEIWGYFKYYFFRVFGSCFIVFVLILIGAFLCFIPGIYLAVVFSLIMPIIVLENASFSYAFNRSFQLIKSNFWVVLGVVVVTILIVWIASSIASVPITIFTLSARFFSNKGYTLPLIIIFCAMRNILMLIYTLPVIAAALCYFNLTELKEGTGLLDRIEKFGKRIDDSTHLPSEGY
jgi:hypothetical protein